jgi:hypothetical protein
MTSEPNYAAELLKAYQEILRLAAEQRETVENMWTRKLSNPLDALK